MLKKLRELFSAATPGPWRLTIRHNKPGKNIITLEDTGIATTGMAGQCFRPKEKDFEDAAYIAAANPQTVLALIDALEIAIEGLKDGCACPGESSWATGKPILCYECEALEKIKAKLAEIE